MATNNFITPDDCNFTEKVAQEFAKLAERFATDDLSIANEDIILLNSNVKVLNEEINKFRGNRFNKILKTPLTATARIEFQTRFVPNTLLSKYRNAIFVYVEDLADFAMNNPELNREFPTVPSVVETLGRIEPSSYPTFGAEYPAVDERLRDGPITAAEMSRLGRQYGLDQNNLADRIRTSISGFLGLLQRLLSGLGLGLGLMGSFCSLINNVFGVVNGIRDSLGNVASFAGDLPRLISSISPRIGEMLETVQSIQNLVEGVRESATTMRTDMQSAFQLISQALNITMQFFNPSTGTPGSVAIEWDFAAIKQAIIKAINDDQPEKNLFIVAEASPDRPLADFNNDGVVDQTDVTILQQYIDEYMEETIEDAAIIQYIETVMVPYMIEDIEKYNAYTEYSTSSSNSAGADISGVVDALSSASQLFGSPGSPDNGDFGLSRLTNILETLGDIGSQISGFINTLQQGLSINIDSILNQIGQIRNLASLVSGDIFNDMEATMQEFRRTAEQALGIAEEVAVSDPQRTREIQESRQTAIGERVTRVLNLSARATSEIVPLLAQRLTGLEGLLRNAGAVGVLDTVEERLTTVVQQAATQLRTVAESFSPTSLDNGFNFNLQTTFARFAGLQARALAATEESSIRHVQDAVRGHIAREGRAFRNPNREDVEFVALRTCNLAGEIERIYNGLIEPLQQMVDQFQATMPALEGAGAEISVVAVRSGAIRFPSSARPAAAVAAAAIPATATTNDPVTGVPLPGGSVPAAPGTLPDRARGPSPRNPAEYADLPSYEDVHRKTWQGLFIFDPGPRSRGSLLYQGLPLRLGWDYIKENEPETMRAFVALARAWRSSGNSSFGIASAYRAPGLTRERISALQRLSQSQWIGRVNPNSLRIEATQHARGKAIDCSIGGAKGGLLQRRFAELARREGFGGIGFYSWGVHVDTGPTRQWGI
jgi:hypothetical protein